MQNININYFSNTKLCMIVLDTRREINGMFGQKTVVHLPLYKLRYYTAFCLTRWTGLYEAEPPGATLYQGPIMSLMRYNRRDFNGALLKFRLFLKLVV